MQCEALEVLKELKGSFAQLQGDLAQYRNHAGGIEEQMEECRGVLRGLNIALPSQTHDVSPTPPGRSAAPTGGTDAVLSPGTLLERDVHRTLDETEQLLTGLRKQSDIDTEPLCHEELTHRKQIEMQFSTRAHEITEEAALMKWQHQHSFSSGGGDIRSSSGGSAKEIPRHQSAITSKTEPLAVGIEKAPREGSREGSAEAEREGVVVKKQDKYDIQIAALLAEGVWKAKQDSRGHTYYYKASDKKTRVWNLKKYLKEIEAKAKAEGAEAEG